ncbi:metallophosphoesterase [Aquimarina rhabdastrellae]
MLRFFLFCLAIAIIDFYGFQLIKSFSHHIWIKISYIFSSVLILGGILYIYTIGRSSLSIQTSNIITGIFLIVYISKLVIALLFLGEDLFRFIKAFYTYLSTSNSTKETLYIPSRRIFVKQLALGLAAIPFTSLLYGIIKGKYNFKVLKYTLYFEDLPEAFNGYQLTQISDLHSGSFDNKEKITYAVDLINKQQSDVILFTGDMVNLTATEMEPWKAVFTKLHAKDGMYSILGNHDYGDYVQWENAMQKEQNLEALKAIQKEIGFDLLLNENRFITKNNDRIAIIGVENWGKGFKQKGDLNLASAGISSSDFKIVLSHDPTHWEEKIVKHKTHYHLTLSGHTHGMQMGIEIPGWFKWSPIKWRYKYWAGIYKENNRFLNVNRGFGFLAYPGRIGIWPEITVINLKKGIKPI